MLDNREAIILDELFANWRSTHGYVENVAHAIALAATKEIAKNRVYNVGEAGITEKKWIQQIAKAIEWNWKVHSIPRNILPESLIYPALDLKQDWVTDTTRIRDELSFEEGFPEI